LQQSKNPPPRNTLGEKKANSQAEVSAMERFCSLPIGHIRVIYRIIVSIVDSRRQASTAITVAGVVAIICSVLVLLGTALGFWAVMSLPDAQNGPAMPAEARAMGEGAMIFFFGMAIFGLFTGVGVLHLKNWARISILIWSGIAAAICGLTVAFLLFLPLPEIPNAPNGVAMTGWVRAGGALIYGAPLGICVWWLILFNRKSIAAQFTAPAPDGPTDASGFPLNPASPTRVRLPLPITVLAVFLLLSSVSVFFIFLAHLPVIIFGYALRGTVGKLVWIPTCVASTAAGIGLLQRKAWGYWLALGLQGFSFLSGIATVVSPRYPELMQEAMDAMRFPNAPYPEYPAEQLRIFSYFGLMFPVIVVLILLYYRTRFLEAAAVSKQTR
jgi:hypothetical protein